MEILTGKCRKDFEQWYSDKHRCNEGFVGTRFIVWFYSMDLSMQYGVLVDFFDNAGLYIEVEPSLTCINELLYYMVYINEEQVCNEELEYEFDIRCEARTEAIKKANKLYNSSVEIHGPEPILKPRVGNYPPVTKENVNKSTKGKSTP